MGKKGRSGSRVDDETPSSSSSAEHHASRDGGGEHGDGGGGDNDDDAQQRVAVADASVSASSSYNSTNTNTKHIVWPLLRSFIKECRARPITFRSDAPDALRLVFDAVLAEKISTNKSRIGSSSDDTTLLAHSEGTIGMRSSSALGDEDNHLKSGRSSMEQVKRRQMEEIQDDTLTTRSLDRDREISLVHLPTQTNQTNDAPTASAKNYTATTKTPTAKTKQPRPKLVLHFDLNKTIVATDAVQNLNSSDLVNVMLAECAWGRLTHDSHMVPSWRAFGRLSLAVNPEDAQDMDLMTYHNFLDSILHPDPGPTDGGDPKKMAEKKKLRQTLKKRFTDDGEPGYMFRSVHDALVSALDDEPQMGMVLPSFFHLLNVLLATSRDVYIVLRSFGSDAVDVARDIERWAKGEHPMSPSEFSSASEFAPDWEFGFGRFERSAGNAESTRMLVGAPGVMWNDESAQPVQEFVGFPAIDKALRTWTTVGSLLASGQTSSWHGPRGRLLVLRDDYPYWHRNREARRAGKLLLLPSRNPRAPEPEEDVLDIMFDDNMGTGGRWGIVDVRDASTGVPVPFQDAIGHNLVRADPIRAILDMKYFETSLSRCELRHRRNYMHMEKLRRAAAMAAATNALGHAHSVPANTVHDENDQQPPLKQSLRTALSTPLQAPPSSSNVGGLSTLFK